MADRAAGPSDEDHDNAARLGLLGLTAAHGLESTMERLAALYPRNNAFPAEVLLELAGEAIAESGASPAEPIVYEGMRNRYLPEYGFRGKSSQHKSHDALMAAAMVGRASTPISSTRHRDGAQTTCGSTPSTPCRSTPGSLPSGRGDRLKPLGPR